MSVGKRLRIATAEIRSLRATIAAMRAEIDWAKTIIAEQEKPMSDENKTTPDDFLGFLRVGADEVKFLTAPQAVPPSALQEAREIWTRALAAHYRHETCHDEAANIIAAAFAKWDEEIATLKNALEVGQANCDDVYNDLREERDALRAAWAEREPQLLRAEREVEELREQLKECRAVCTREFIAKNELSDQLATARKDSELAEETIRAIQAVNVNGFGRVADLAISRLINTHYSAAMTAQEGQKP